MPSEQGKKALTTVCELGMTYVCSSMKYMLLIQGACTRITCPLIGYIDVSPKSVRAPSPVQFTTRSYPVSSCEPIVSA